MTIECVYGTNGARMHAHKLLRTREMCPSYSMQPHLYALQTLGMLPEKEYKEKEKGSGLTENRTRI